MTSQSFILCEYTCLCVRSPQRWKNFIKMICNLLFLVLLLWLYQNISRSNPKNFHIEVCYRCPGFTHVSFEVSWFGQPLLCKSWGFWAVWGQNCLITRSWQETPHPALGCACECLMWELQGGNLFWNGGSKKKELFQLYVWLCFGVTLGIWSWWIKW